jgi:PLP dependent protein
MTDIPQENAEAGSPPFRDVVTNYHALMQRIEAVAQRSPLASHNILLIAVTKQQAVEKIKMLLAQGHHFFGENRVSEAQAKWPALKKVYPKAELHLIGALQTNKVRTSVGLFDVIETLDRVALAQAIEKEAARVGKVQRCFIQVNIGEEPQKAGIAPAALEAFYALTLTLPHIKVEGLMCIPPEGVAPAPYFALMREYQQRLGLPYLSMGMSGDFEEAVRFGATHVRIGTALMGARALPL